jgi:hypothetical protein
LVHYYIKEDDEGKIVVSYDSWKSSDRVFMISACMFMISCLIRLTFPLKQTQMKKGLVSLYAFFDLFNLYGGFIMMLIALSIQFADQDREHVYAFLKIILCLNGTYFFVMQAETTIYMIQLMLARYDYTRVLNNTNLMPQEIFMTDAAPRVTTRADMYEFCWSMQLKPEYQSMYLAKKGASITGIDYKNFWIAIETYNIFALFCAFTQGFLAYLILVDTMQVMQVFQPGHVMTARILCTLVMHFSFADENNNAMKLYKYTVMHSNKFQNPTYALLLVQLQLFLGIFVELVSIAALNTYDSVTAIVMNFLCFSILREFDGLFLGQFINPKLKQLANLELPRENFKADKVIIKAVFDVSLSVFTEKQKQLKKLITVVKTSGSAVSTE